MTPTKTIDTPKPAAPPRALGHAAAVIAARQVAGLRQRRAERAELHALSDREMRDIGLNRSEAFALAAGIHPRGAASPASRGTQRIAAVARMAGRLIMAVLARLRERHEQRKAMHALMAMGDHGLKDIGLHRSGIGNAVRMGRDGPPVTATAPSGLPAPAAGRR